MLTGIVMYLKAKILKFFGRLTPIFKTVKNNLNSGLFEGLQFVENIDDSAIVGRIGDIEGDNMKILLRTY